MKFAALLAVCALIGCAGCGSGDSNSNTGNNAGLDTIVGRWAASTIQGPGDVARSCPTSITVSGTTYACGLIDTQIFRSDGSYQELTGDQRGTYSINGNALTISVTGAPVVVYSYSIQNDILTEQLSTGSGPVTLTFRRQ